MAAPREYPWAFYPATVLLSVLFTLALVEIGLALTGPVPFSVEHNMYYEADLHTGYKLKPYSIGHFQNGIRAETNLHGHRDDAPTEHDGEKCRVLVLGDSLSVGNNVMQEDAYPQVLERMLGDEFSFPVGVINASVGGWSPFQYAQYYEHYGKGFDHQIVLVGFFVGNDSYSQTASVQEDRTAIAGRRVSQRAALNPLARARVFLHENFHLARYIGSRRTPLDLNRTRDHCEDFSETFLEVQRRRFSNHLREEKQLHSPANSVHQVERIEKRARAQSIPVLVALLPDENQINPGLQKRLMNPTGLVDYDFEMPQKELVARFDDRQIETVDLLPRFQEDTRCLYMNDTHWNADGHRLAAEILFERLTPLVAEMCSADPNPSLP